MNKRPFVDHQSRRTRLLPSTSFLVSSRGPSLPEGSAFRLVRSPRQGRNNLAHRETSFFLSGGKLETTMRSPAPCCRRPVAKAGGVCRAAATFRSFFSTVGTQERLFSFKLF